MFDLLSISQTFTQKCLGEMLNFFPEMFRCYFFIKMKGWRVAHQSTKNLGVDETCFIYLFSIYISYI